VYFFNLFTGFVNTLTSGSRSCSMVQIYSITPYLRDTYFTWIYNHKRNKIESRFLIILIIMIFEHIIYSSALAILVGMVFYKFTGRDHSWIIIVCAWAPDIVGITIVILNNLGFTHFYRWYYIFNPILHTVAMMVIFGIIAACLLHPFGIRFFDALFFSLLGLGAHLFEDALVFKVGYPYLWPFSSQKLGIGLIPTIVSEETYIRDFLGIANTDVLIIGVVFFLLAILIRTWYEGFSWIRWYMPDKMYVKFFGK